MTFDLAACPDGELAAMAVADRATAYPVLMQRHQARIFRLIRSHVGDSSEALDLVQETFVAAWLALERYDPARPFPAWLARIALNKCRDWGRRRAVRRFFTFAAPIDDGIAQIADDAVAADAALAGRQTLALAARALSTLPVKLREPLILCAIEGLSQADAAAILGITEKAVETRIRRARALLTEILGPR